MIIVFSLASLLIAIFGLATGHVSQTYLIGYVPLIVVPLLNGWGYLTKKNDRYKHSTLFIVTNTICWFAFVPMIGDLVFHY